MREEVVVAGMITSASQHAEAIQIEMHLQFCPFALTSGSPSEETYKSIQNKHNNKRC